MSRKDEINLILKTLLSKTIMVIDNNQHTSYTSEVKESAEKVVEVGKEIKEYLDELKNLK